MTKFSLKIEGKIVKGFFKARLNRFSALVKLGGEEVRCFLPNPGRLKELLIPDAKVFLKEIKESRDRLTIYDLIAVKHGRVWVFIDSRMPNRILSEALKKHEIEEFSMYDGVRPEFKFGNSKFDFFLTNSIERCILEAKSCTLVKNGRALFPDAPTERGRRHVLELIEAKEEGYRACILFLIQRPDADFFSSNDEVDPKFGEALRKALKYGLEVYAYRSYFNMKTITLLDKVELIFR